MIIQPGFAGIDISKLTLEVFDGRLGKSETFDNTLVATRKLARRFKTQGTFVLFEAGGRYDRALRMALIKEGVVFARVNPARARDFARATGTLAKTDSIDAGMLAAMAQSLNPAAYVPKSQEREDLAELHTRREQLVRMRSMEKVRLDGLVSSGIRSAIERHIDLLSADIQDAEAEIASLIAASPELASTSTALRSVPGIGKIAAATLMAYLPELGKLTPQTIASLSGLAPFNADSGQFRGKRKTRGGRRRIARILYLCAVTATRSNSIFARTYKRLTAKGKPAKVALIAVARKILITANAIIRDNATLKTT
jgi:transposase